MTIYDDEIDLRPYIFAVARYWWLVALITLLFAGAAIYFTLRQPIVYSTTATILVNRSQASLELAEQFPTVREPVDVRSRMEAYLSLAMSDSLAMRVIESSGDQLPPRLRNPEALKDKVEVFSKGETILVKAEGDSPNQATRIANQWAQEAVNVINAAYSGEQPLEEIQSQVQSARQTYEESQLLLEEFIQKNNIEFLEKRILETEHLFSSLTEDRSWQILYYTRRKQDMENIRNQAEALKRQLQAGSRSEVGYLGDAVAVLVARAKAFGITTNLAPLLSEADPSSNPQDQTLPRQETVTNPSDGFTLSLQINDLTGLEDSSPDYVADLDTLINLSNEEVEKAGELINGLGREVTEGEANEAVEETAATLGTLKKQLESERSQLRELTNSRELAWAAYQAIAQKEVELKNTGPANHQVTMASPAIPPERPVAQSLLQNIVFVSAIGLVLGVLIVVGLKWLRALLRREARASTLAAEKTNR